ncbi:FTR1 family protein [Streptomyces sp. NPDC020875]|uniref:FTR1 family protein n=1 Tax=Streptomyces sp. NPDC020875 TaxID=3154898 RepID=UPI0033E90128
MDGTFLFGLSIGLSVGVVIVPLLAASFMVGRGDLVRPVLAAVFGTLAVLVVVESVFESGSRYPTLKGQLVLAGVLSLVSVVLLSWVVYEVLRAGARGYEPSRRGVYTGAAVAAGVCSVAPGGLIPAQFLSAAARAATGESASVRPLMGVLLGMFTAAVVGIVVFQVLLRLRPGRGFFAGLALALVVGAAGTLALAVANFQVVDVLGGDLTPVYDVYAEVPPDSWYSAVLTSLVGFQHSPTVLQVTVWFLYLVPAVVLVLAPIKFGRSVGGHGGRGKDGRW